MQSLENKYSHAVNFFECKCLDKAACCCKDILNQAPRHADTLHLMGEIAFKTHDFPQAAQYFEDALKNHKNNNEDIADDCISLGRAYVEMELFDQAQETFLQAITLAPFNDAIPFMLGNLMRRLSRIKAAASCYRHAISLNPCVAKYYLHLGAMLNILEEPKDAEFNFQIACELEPENMTAKHMLAAIQGLTTQTAPALHVKNLFDRASCRYDDHMVKELEYQAPDLMFNLMASTYSELPFFDNAMDLGCGTGMAGMKFRKLCRHLSGIDLAPKMVEVARKKSIYDALYVGNIIEMLDDLDAVFDFFIASDVLVYMGDLIPLFQALRRCAESKAVFIFSTESVPGQSYILRPSGRYGHSRDYILDIARQFGIKIRAFDAGGIRKEKGKWLTGGIWLLRF